MSARRWTAALACLLAWPAQAQEVMEYIHTDALGSVVAVTDQARNVLERRKYEPYGKQLAPLPVENGPGYTGHVLDALTGMVQMQQRYMDPMFGRFLSVDPVTAFAVPGVNFNRYAYAANNPYRFTDPDGRQIRPINAPPGPVTECSGYIICDGVGPPPLPKHWRVKRPAGSFADGSTPSFPTSGAEDVNVEALFSGGDLLAELESQTPGSQAGCQSVPELCRTPADDLIRAYGNFMLDAALTASGSGVARAAVWTLKSKPVQKLACGLAVCAASAGDPATIIARIRNLDGMLDATRAQRSVGRREVSEARSRLENEWQYP